MSGLIDLEDVALSRGARIVLSGLTLSVGAGDIIWVQGPNGSGKSTLLRTMAGLLPVTSGQMVRARPPEELISYIGHRDGLETRARLETEAAFWLGQSDIRQRLGIADDDPRRIYELSAGQRRRFEILRLLVTDKPVWLLDEPFASLDADGVAALTQTIAHKAASGGAVVIASHMGLPEFGRVVRRVSLETGG